MSVFYSKVNSNLEAAPDYQQPLIIPSAPLPTIKIASTETECGFVIINRSDFDPATMTEFGVAPAVAAKGKAAK